MELKLLKPRLALNKSFLKVKPGRSEIEMFKKNLIRLIDCIDESEYEEFHKNEVSKFLKETYYDTAHYLNTKDRKDLVIHNGATAATPVAVIIEAKKPANKSEMIRPDNLNTKAFQELVLYYLRERITLKNTELKQLIATNIYEWYIFDAQLFERFFAQNKSLVRKFVDFEEGRLGGHKTDFFYTQVAAPAISAITQEITFTCFDIRHYEKPLRNNNPKDDHLLIALYKLLSPQHLLKLPFANDSNSLDKIFYTELLHIIGLAEIKEGSKKLIQRKKEGERNSGSLIENTITQLDCREKLSRLPRLTQYGQTHQEQLFGVALELVITWVNRVLFLKLLEAQLLSYHKGDKAYNFLNSDKIRDYDDLDKLFFRVLAKQTAERDEPIQQLFGHVPYLNSSLFEPTELEHQTLFVSALENNLKLPLLSSTVLKDATGRKMTKPIESLQYLFGFMDAYNFSSEGTEEIQEDNKRLINASVLGLIFEKINGYKDGSFFTPGFITMYMCRETIRRAVVQKFNEAKGWGCSAFDELYDRIEERAEANAIINSLKICDPAVGSGHFLVSALNEIIAIKSELRILQDRNGKRLKEYTVQVENDELVVTDEDGLLFEYNPNSRESQRVQETLFHEKQTIIENCLFGVDINPNSVKICRLRLWIELLKNAYYRATPLPNTQVRELETLPNIDINIKCGNSLISRFSLDADLRQALKSSKYSIDSYRVAVDTYRNAQNKAQKHEMERLIASIKSDFRSNIDNPFRKTISTARGKVDVLATQINTKKQWGEKVDKKALAEFEKAVAKLKKLENERDDIEANKIYENAFEWRFEFPEVLNDEGDFVGFDVVIGNPPYGVSFNKENGNYYESLYKTFNLRGESYTLFIEKAITVLKISGHFGFIIPDTILNLGFTEAIRKYILKNTKVSELTLLPSNVFLDATVDTTLLFFQKEILEDDYNKVDVLVNTFDKKILLQDLRSPVRSFVINSEIWFETNCFNLQSNSTELEIISKIDKKFPLLEAFTEMFSGIKAYEVGKGKPAQTPVIRDTKPFTSNERETKDWLPFFDGKDIGYYSLLWKENNWIHYGAWLAAPRLPENFEGEKILIRKITGKTLIANYISYTSYCNTLLFVLKLKKDEAKISYRTLLGILNSKFIGWYFRKKFQITNEDSFPQIMIRDIQQFAVPNEVNAYTKEIESVVDKILISKQENQDTADLEAQIDQLVYELYGLTEDEIKIVEGTV